MHARLRRQKAVRVLTLHTKCRALDAGLLAGLEVQDLCLEAALLGPLQVHAQKHLGPVLRVRAARARLYRADGVARVHRAGQEHLGLGLRHLVFEARDEFAQLTCARLVFGCEFKEHCRIGDRRLETLLSLDDALDAAALLQDFLRGLLVRPEVRLRSLLFEPTQLRALRRYIKETSRAARRACAGLRPASASPGLHYR